MNQNKPGRVAIVGTGPAALMAADVLSSQGHLITFFESEKGPSQKLLIAGSSGLNVTHDALLEDFHHYYQKGAEFMAPLLDQFSPHDWLCFLNDLGLTTFLGTSRRYFIQGLKASGLVKSWIKRLQNRGALFCYGIEVDRFSCDGSGQVVLFSSSTPSISTSLSPAASQSQSSSTSPASSSDSSSSSSFSPSSLGAFDAVCFCLGGGSYLSKPATWPKMFENKLAFTPFEASNVGYEIKWTEKFLSEAEGLPLKNILFTSSQGSMRGDLMVTRHGLEGTPVYTYGTEGKVTLDLKPDMALDKIVSKISGGKENFSPIRRVKKYLHLCPAAEALLFHHGDRRQFVDASSIASEIKNLKLNFVKKRPLPEAISSSGGVALEEVNSQLMVKKFPGVFLAGEMLDWDAPTGGFLIQACVSQGYCAGQGMTDFLKSTLGEQGSNHKSS